MALRTVEGGALISLAGEARPQDWLHFFQEWFDQHGWSTSQDWQSMGGMWHGRFQNARQEFAVQIVVEPQDPIHAVMAVTPL